MAGPATHKYLFAKGTEVQFNLEHHPDALGYKGDGRLAESVWFEFLVVPKTGAVEKNTDFRKGMKLK